VAPGCFARGELLLAWELPGARSLASAADRAARRRADRPEDRLVHGCCAALSTHWDPAV